MARYWLTILQGPNKGMEIDLEEDEIIVGRHPDCLININDTEVSRKHFVLRKKENDYWIEDLNSTNGSIVNGRPIDAIYRLRNNSKINLGENVNLIFKMEEPQAVEEATQPIKIEEPQLEEFELEPIAVDAELEPIAVDVEKEPLEEIAESEWVLEDLEEEIEPELEEKPQKPQKEEEGTEQKKKMNWWTMGCSVIFLILVVAAASFLIYIDNNFLWCNLFGDWIPVCY